MKFGKLPSVDHVDWSLPPDPDITTHYLRSRGSKGPARFYLGAPAWGHREWIGKIYPRGTRSADFLYHYARAFNCIELNTTHYRIPSRDQVEKWAASVPPEFRFCPKVYQGISHEPNGLTDRALSAEWQTSLDAFGENLGPSFLQLPPSFGYSDKVALHRFLQSWPAGRPLAIELRHPSWFEQGQVRPALVEYLQGRGIGLVITDVAGHRELAHASIGAPFVLLRFVGNDLHPTDFPRAEEWLRRISVWAREGLGEIYFFAHEPDDLHAPDLAREVLEHARRFPELNTAGIEIGLDQGSLIGL